MSTASQDRGRTGPTEIIRRYFPEFNQAQINQFRHLEMLYKYWNQKINLVSRQDIDQLYTRHILHSLAIARFIRFLPGSAVVDVGTGGGFPGLPLAIAFPQVDFTLVDVIEKKIRVVDVLYRNLALQNVTTVRRPAEDTPGQFDFAVSRAVADMSTLKRWTKGLIREGADNDLPNGLIALKGGSLTEELAPFGNRAYRIPVSEWFNEPFFQDKFVVYLPN